MELNEFFTFYVPGYKFMPAFRNKLWDGKIRLFNYQTRQLYYGLLPYLVRFAAEREYEIEYDEAVKATSTQEKFNQSLEKAKAIFSDFVDGEYLDDLANAIEDFANFVSGK